VGEDSLVAITGGTVRGSNPGGREIFPTRPGALQATHIKGTWSLQGVKRSGRGVDHPTTPSAEVKERVQLYIYSPCGLFWPVPG
jgi:hypothetical protein